MKENVIFNYLGLPYIIYCLIWLILITISCTFLKWSWFQSCLKLNKILMGMSTPFSLSIHSLMHIRLILCLKLWECINEHVCTSVSVGCWLLSFGHGTTRFSERATVYRPRKYCQQNHRIFFLTLRQRCFKRY